MYTFFVQAQSDKIKLQLRVEELQHKYEPKGNHATTTMKMMILKHQQWFLHLAFSKNLPEKRKKEKLPLDVAPSSKQSLERFEQIFAAKMEETNTNTTEPEASSVHKDEIQSSIQGVSDSAALNTLPFFIDNSKASEKIWLL